MYSGVCLLMALSAFLIAVAAPAASASVPPPLANLLASEVSFQASGKCGPNSIKVSNYGASSSGPPAILINGRPAEGSPVAEFIEFLSHKKGLYRFRLGCLNGSNIALTVMRAETGTNGEAGFEMFFASFDGGRLVGVGQPKIDKDDFLKIE